MFGWFKSSKVEKTFFESHAGKMLDQMAVAVAVSETAAEYFLNYKNRPICKDSDADLLEMWRGTRLEAISRLWNFGAANIELIISPIKHPQLLDSIIKEAGVCGVLSFSKDNRR
jgi:hypothetical protein